MEVWVDVGGTFTDCIGRGPDGRLEVCKVLSTGAVKGRSAQGSTAAALVDPGRVEPEGFFDGYGLELFDSHGAVTGRSRVRRFRKDRIELETPIPSAEAGLAYELSAGESGPVLGVRRLLGLRLTDSVPPVDMLLGTTRGTNALLERKVAGTVFVTTEGFADILRIGTQNRPKLFELAILKPAPLFEDAIGLRERIDARGRVLVPLDAENARAQLEAAVRGGREAAAICLLNACANPAHELEAERLAREAGFRQVSVSTRVSPLLKIVPRGDTTVLDAAVTPVLRDYVAGLRAAMPEGRLRIMTSVGGLVDADAFSGKDSLLSGPAGGVVGFAHAAREAGIDKAIGFDMGGTSTDVSRFDGEFEVQYET
ncbi:MAG TPA: hydantoinase/oxoprolinase N-terminal domain-containing protein, partial [Planctomycetota bacterium]|nr:hydantoinase/oxoprolinase N-terminal domain-containing protein [Planctomycetota bacterium]